jgi:23S rRNA-intervening sequence protein
MCDTNKVMTKPGSIAGNEKLAIEVQTTIDLLTTIEFLPGNKTHDALVRQLIRCSTSIGTNYGYACSAKSTRDFINKLRKQEIDNNKTREKLDVLLTEANQLLSMYEPSLKGVGENQKIVHRK